MSYRDVRAVWGNGWTEQRVQDKLERLTAITVRNGAVFVVEPGTLPDGVEAAAIYRF